MNRFIRYIASVFLITSIVICSEQTSNTIDESVVARVGDIRITVDEFKNSYEFGPAFVKRQPDSKLNHLNYMIDEKLLSFYALEMGLDSSEQVKEMCADIENDLITELMFKKEILPFVEYTDDEVDSIVIQKTLELEIRWLYAENEGEIANLLSNMNLLISFDSLYNKQTSDSVFTDARSMKISRYDLGKKNPLLADVIDTFQVGSYSAPIKTNDGWYIIQLKNVSQNAITVESQCQKLRQEAVSALMKRKMEQISDEFIEKLYNDNSPVINKDEFNIALVYTANFVLSKELYKDWQLSELLQKSLNNLGGVTKDKISELILVSLNNGNINLDEFLKWFRNRIQYLKFDKSSLNNYGLSLFSIVQKMIRDKVLIDEVYKKGYQNDPGIALSMNNWKDKMLFSAARNELMNSVFLNNNEVNYLEDENHESDLKKMRADFSIKLFRLLKELRSKYKVEINREVLKSVQVSEENNPSAIEMYTVKKGGLLPRMPYPTIDNDWQYWQ